MGNPVRVAIIGVGNCASSLVQGVEFYKNAKKTDFVPGLMHPVVGGYHVRDIEFVAAIDIDKNKVGKDLSEAIFTTPNNTVKFSDVPSKTDSALSGSSSATVSDESCTRNLRYRTSASRGKGLSSSAAWCLLLNRW